MPCSTLDDALASGKTYGDLATQHALYARLRAEDPLHWCEPQGYRPFWAVTRHADIIEVERQHDRFVNKLRTKLLSIEFETRVREAMAGQPMLWARCPRWTILTTRPTASSLRPGSSRAS